MNLVKAGVSGSGTLVEDLALGKKKSHPIPLKWKKGRNELGKLVDLGPDFFYFLCEAESKTSC